MARLGDWPTYPRSRSALDLPASLPNHSASDFNSARLNDLGIHPRTADHLTPSGVTSATSPMTQTTKPHYRTRTLTLRQVRVLRCRTHDAETGFTADPFRCLECRLSAHYDVDRLVCQRSGEPPCLFSDTRRPLRRVAAGGRGSPGWPSPVCSSSVVRIPRRSRMHRRTPRLHRRQPVRQSAPHPLRLLPIQCLLLLSLHPLRHQQPRPCPELKTL